MDEIKKTPATQETAPRLPYIPAGGRVQAIVPQDFDSAWRIANAVVKAGMAPRGLDTPEKAMVAIMHGLEVGLTPMAALQSIAVVNGRPTIYGDGALGLVRASGLLEWIEEKIMEEEGENPTAICRVKRRGHSVIERRFSRQDAEIAHLWNKRGRDGQETPWQTYPLRMLMMRARAFALRDGFADVLRGLSLREEVEDIPADDMPQKSARIVQPPIGGGRKALPPIAGTSEKTNSPGDGAAISDVQAAPHAEPQPPPPPPPSPPQPPPSPPPPPPLPFSRQIAAGDPGDIPPPLRRARRKEAEQDNRAGIISTDVDAWLNDLDGALSGCESATSLWEIQASVMMPMRGMVPAAAWRSAEALLASHFRRISEESEESEEGERKDE